MTTRDKAKLRMPHAEAAKASSAKIEMGAASGFVKSTPLISAQVGKEGIQEANKKPQTKANDSSRSPKPVLKVSSSSWKGQLKNLVISGKTKNRSPSKALIFNRGEPVDKESRNMR